jgi:hypothetical protein
MMSENIARNMYRSQGTINYPTQLHLVGHFHKYIMIHGSLNIKFTFKVLKCDEVKKDGKV